MNILLWHVHGSWTTSFVSGDHDYLLPVLPGRPADGRGRASSWTWPSSAREIPPEELGDEPVDVVIVQREAEIELATHWLRGRVPGRDVPMVWLEHNTPPDALGRVTHPAAHHRDTVLVHVTPTNALLWDSGGCASTVIEHGIADPGPRYTGELGTAAVVVNEPVRRGRAVGADLLGPLGHAMPVDVFGMGVDTLPDDPGVVPCGNLVQDRLFDELGRRRAYVHPFRWTSLGMSLVEAMMLGMPVVALAMTAVPDAVPADAGVVSNRLDDLTDALRRFAADPADAYEAGRRARAAALEQFGLERFLDDWNDLLTEVTR